MADDSDMKQLLPQADDSDMKQLLPQMETYCKELQSLLAFLEGATSDCVTEMYGIADDVDKFHKGATITNVVGSAVGIAGGITTIVGIALAPVTLGASLIVSAVGISVATAGGVTGVSASIANTVNTKSKCNAVNKKIEEINDKINEIEKLASDINKFATHVRDKVKGTLNPDIGKICGRGVFAAIEIGRLVQLGRISTAAARGIELATQGARAIRAVSGVFSALFLVIDATYLYKGSVELHRGAKTEAAAQIREKAYELAEKWNEMRENNNTLVAYITSFISELKGE